MFLKIIKIKNIKNAMQGVNHDPVHLASEMAGNIFLGMFLVPAIVAILFLVLFFVLGYTHWLGGRFRFFRFLFILSVIGDFLFFFVLYRLYRLVRAVSRTPADTSTTIEVESEVIE